MPRYYCDYCDTYLTHDSPSVRKQHNAGYKHKANVRTYYQQFEEQQTQSLIDQRIKEHLGQAAAFQTQVGATFHQHLGVLPMQRPRLPILPTPILPPNTSMPVGNPPLMPGMRPPVLPRLPGAPGYMPIPGAPQGMMPPSSGMQMNGLPGPPPMNPSASVGSAPLASANQTVYQAGPTSASGGYNSYLSSSTGLQGSPSGGPGAPAGAAPQDGYKYSQPESNQ